MLLPKDPKVLPKTENLVPVKEAASLFAASKALFTSINLFNIGILFIPSSILPVRPRFFSISTNFLANLSVSVT